MHTKPLSKSDAVTSKNLVIQLGPFPALLAQTRAVGAPYPDTNRFRNVAIPKPTCKMVVPAFSSGNSSKHHIHIWWPQTENKNSRNLTVLHTEPGPDLQVKVYIL